MVKIDFKNGTKSETLSLEDFNEKYKLNISGVNSITVYSVAEVEPRRSCKNHQGLVSIEGIVYPWSEDCDCV